MTGSTKSNTVTALLQTLMLVPKGKSNEQITSKVFGKSSAVALAAGVGVASGKIAMASPAKPGEGTRPLLDAVIAGQGKYNRFLYASGDLLLEVLRMAIPNVPGIDVAAATAKLNQAEGYLDRVPSDDPPKCILPPGWGGYGGG